MVRLSVLAVFILTVRLSLSAESPPPSADAIADAIKRLSDEDFAARETATKALWSMGAGAEQALKSAAESPDPETASRARRILDDLAWGIQAGAPPEVVEKIREFRAGDDAKQNEAVDALLQMGLPGFDAAVHIALRQKEPERRGRIEYSVTAAARNLAVELIAGSSDADAVKVLELAASLGNINALMDFSVYLARNGMAGARIAELRARPELNDAERALLGLLLRTNNDPVAARAAFAKTTQKFLIQMQMVDMKEWLALAEASYDAPPSGENPVITAGRKATYYRLAGERQKFDAAVADLRKLAAQSLDAAETAASFLFMNGCLDNNGDSEHLKDKPALYEVFVSVQKTRARQGLEALEKNFFPEGRNLLVSYLQKAELHLSLGNKGTANADVKKATAMLEAKRNAWAIDSILRFQRRAGMSGAERLKLAVNLLKAPPEDKNQDLNDWSSLFQYRYEHAAIWNKMLGELYPGEKAPARLERMERLFSPEGGLQQLIALIPEIERLAAKAEAGDRGLYFQATIAALNVSGDDVTANQLVEKWAPDAQWPWLLLTFGDRCAQKSDWAAAADAYQRAAAIVEPNGSEYRALAIFLMGAAQSRLDRPEGSAAMRRGQSLLLCDDSQLQRFVEALHKRPWTGHAEEDECVFEQRIGIDVPVYGAQGVARFYARREEFSAAEQIMQHANLYYINCGSPPSPDYVFLENVYRARGQIRAGKIAEALVCADIAIAVCERRISSIGSLVCDLEKLGHKEEADRLYAKARSALEIYVDEDLSDSNRHNRIAWLEVYCRRDLDDALAHAERGLALDPDLPYLGDTYAEILFQRGDKAKAIEVEKRCSRINGTHKYYERQIKRFEAGNPATPIPDGDD